MLLQLCADDIMPWGKHEGKTLREIYKKNRSYFNGYILNDPDHIFLSETTKRILENDLSEKEMSIPSYTKERTSYMEELKQDSIIPIGPFKGRTLKEILIRNVSYYRYLTIQKQYYISKETFDLMNTYSDILMKKLQNRENAKIYTEEDFNNIADWSECEHPNSDTKFYISIKGKTICCDSKTEIKLLEHIKENSLAKVCAGQSLCIPYDSPFIVDKKYYPDIVMLTQDNHIAIIEVKPITAMSHHTNIEKYRALKDYCIKNGYMFVMIDPDNDYMTFEELAEYDVDPDLDEYIDNCLTEIDEDECPFFTTADVDKWFKIYDNTYASKEIYLQVHSLVIKKDYYNKYKHGFLVSPNPVK